MMITIKGKWYSGKTSAQNDALLRVCEDGSLRIEHPGQGVIHSLQKPEDLSISDRLADTHRFITFPDGGIFETDENDAVDRIFEARKKLRSLYWVHILESRRTYVLLAGAAILLVGFLLVRFGIPAMAKVVAGHLPRSFFMLAEKQTIAVLDKSFFDPSELPVEKDNQVRSALRQLLDSHQALNIGVIFRKGGRLGPNAFALPAGTVILTDELVRLAEHDDELVGVVAHEIGHIAHNHGMRRIVQDSLLSFAFLALTGDSTGVSELFLGFPVVLTELAYSREFERDADRYAMAYLIDQGIEPSKFSDLLGRIAKIHGEQEDSGNSKWSGYLATHPHTQERLIPFREADRNTN